MGDVAASGGYFISAPADVIVAQPGTITGSIGVFMGKPVLRELFGRAGRRDRLDRGRRGRRAARRCSPRPGRSPRPSGRGSTSGSTRSTRTSRRRWRPGGGCPPSGCTSWPAAGYGPAPTRSPTGWPTRPAACARRSPSPASAPGCPPTRRCAVYPRLGPLDQLRPAESSEAQARGARPARRGRARRAVRRRLGPGLAVRGGGGAAAVRPAHPARRLENQLDTERVRADWTPHPADAAARRTGAPAGDGLRDALSAWAAGVTLLTIADDRDDIGTTVSAFMPVSLDPPLVAVSLIAGSYPAEVLSRPVVPRGAVRRHAAVVCAEGAGRPVRRRGRPSARLILDAVPHARGADVGRADPVRRPGRA